MIKVKIIKEFEYNKEKVWDIVTDNSNYSWRSDLKKLEIVDENHFIEYDENNYQTNFTIIKKDAFKEYCLDFENTNIKGKWTGIFEELGNGNVLLDFTEEVEVKNIIMKIFARFYLKRFQKRYMLDLERKLLG